MKHPNPEAKNVCHRQRSESPSTYSSQCIQQFEVGTRLILPVTGTMLPMYGKKSLSSRRHALAALKTLLDSAECSMCFGLEM